MGLLDILAGVATVVDAFSDHNTYFNVKCENLEIFEIGSQWKGTARVYGAGEHIKTVPVNYDTVISMPAEESSRYTRRGELRRQLREWVSKNFTESINLPKEFLVLNDSENCLSFEGYAKKVDSDYYITLSSTEAQYYVSYKLNIFQDSKMLGHKDLSYYFIEPTQGRVSSVNVHDGF